METLTEITKAQQIKDILEPIPEHMFMTDGLYTYEDGEPRNSMLSYEPTKDIGKSCAVGHINRVIGKHPAINIHGFGAIPLTQKFLVDRFGLQATLVTVNDSLFVNGYTDPSIKVRVMHLLDDMIKAGY
jgi:hypothetical protein